MKGGMGFGMMKLTIEMTGCFFLEIAESTMRMEIKKSRVVTLAQQML